MALNSYERWVRPWLFRMDAEQAHETVLAALERAQSVPSAAAWLGARLRFDHPSLAVEVAGLSFPNPVGLAAGFDKDCRLAAVLPSLGFGFLELGTVTPRPQPGNARPRVFRIPEAEAVLNRLGFPGCGADEAARHLRGGLARMRPRVPVGINLGMNKDTPPERAPEDYCAAMEPFRDLADYFTINVSSPNTSRLRDLQDKLKLERILTSLRSVNKEGRPIFVKLAPDLAADQLRELLPMLQENCSGLVVSNTTVAREGLPERWTRESGGLSGAPLGELSTRLIGECHRLTQGKLPIIGVGGILRAEDAYHKLLAGATLVQVYTGLVYRGPGLVRRINEGLVDLLASQDLTSVAQAVGRPRREAAK